MLKNVKNGSISQAEINYLLSAESTSEICKKEIPLEKKELIHKILKARDLYDPQIGGSFNLGEAFENDEQVKKQREINLDKAIAAGAIRRKNDEISSRAVPGASRERGQGNTQTGVRGTDGVRTI